MDWLGFDGRKPVQRASAQRIGTLIGVSRRVEIPKLSRLLRPRDRSRSKNAERATVLGTQRNRTAGVDPGQSAALDLSTHEPGGTPNIEPSNAEHRMAARILAHFGVRNSMLDLRCYPLVQGFNARMFTSGKSLPEPALGPR